MYRLTIYVLGKGERVPFLLDDRGLPLFYPTLYATSQLRNAGAAVNTIRNKLADILVLLRWEADHKRDLVDEFKQGRFPALADILSIRDFAQLDMRAIGEPNPVRAGKSHAKAPLEAHVGRARSRPTVSGTQHYNRLTTIADYLEFVATVVTQHKHSTSDVDAIATMAKQLRRHRPRGLANRLADDPLEKSPPSALIEEFMAVAGVEHPRNPFRDAGVRLRNAIIFGLLRYTGMRRGELLSLRTDQVDLGDEPLVWIRRNQDDVHDTRRYQPVAKTKERPLPIPRSLADQIRNYILCVRATIPRARQHPYLLVSHKKGRTYGDPLSVTALGSQVMARMRSVDPSFAQIHPHAFRHHFNYELSVKVDEHNAKVRSGAIDGVATPITQAQEDDVRAFVNGHRSKASGAAYNQRHVREVADQAIRGIQSALVATPLRKDQDASSH